MSDVLAALLRCSLGVSVATIRVAQPCVSVASFKGALIRGSGLMLVAAIPVAFIDPGSPVAVCVATLLACLVIGRRLVRRKRKQTPRNRIGRRRRKRLRRRWHRQLRRGREKAQVRVWAVAHRVALDRRQVAARQLTPALHGRSAFALLHVFVVAGAVLPHRWR